MPLPPTLRSGRAVAAHPTPPLSHPAMAADPQVYFVTMCHIILASVPLSAASIFKWHAFKLLTCNAVVLLALTAGGRETC